MKYRNLLLLFVAALTACTKPAGNRELERAVSAVIEHQADPRPYAAKFRGDLSGSKEALARLKRPFDNASRALGWLYYDWGAFEDAWVFVRLGQPDEAWDPEIGRRLIWLLDTYGEDPTDPPKIRAEKKWAWELVEKARADRLAPEDALQLCRPDTLAHLTAYTVACRRGLPSGSARAIFGALQTSLFVPDGISDWTEFGRQLPRMPENLAGDVAVILAVLEKNGHQELLPVISRPEGERRLSSELLEKVFARGGTIPPGDLAYHQRLLAIVAQP